MICKEGAIDVISIGGNVVHTTNTFGGGGSAAHHHNSIGGNNSVNGHHTLQHRRKSQLITFSASSCDIKNSLSHEIILVNSNTNSSGNNSSNSNSNNSGGTSGSATNSGTTGGNGPRGSIVGSISNGSGAVIIGNGSCGSGSAGVCNVRLSFAEEDIMIVANGTGGDGSAGSASVSGSGSGGSGSGNDGDLDDDVFRRRSLDVDEVEDDVLFDDVYGTHIDVPHNANDDSGGGSYEDSHAMHSSLAGSNRNSLERDDDIEADVISTDVSCYDQLLGSSCNTRNDEDEIATLVGESENYTKLCRGDVKGTTASNGVGVGSGGGVGVGVGENGGIIYANPFMDDEGIAESGM